MNKRSWIVLSVVSLGAVTCAWGCGSNSSSGGPGGDGGEEAGDAAAEAGDDGGGMDSTTGTDAGKDSGTGKDATTDSSASGDSSSTRDSGSTGDSSSTGDSGSTGDSSSATDSSSGDSSSLLDSALPDANVGCGDATTACSLTSEAGATINAVCLSATCAPCSLDTECTTAYGGGYICDTASGSCVQGNCHSNTDCTGDGGALSLCVNNTCTACSAVANGEYYVDPVNGSDSLGTGSDTAGSQTASVCAFKTITRALQAIAASSFTTGNIHLLGDDPGSNGETFPLTIPTGFTVLGAAPTTTVTVPATQGFVLVGTAAINALTIVGSATGTAGVTVGGTSGSNASLTSVTVSGFAVGDGVLVNQSGVVTINANVTLTLNQNGLHVTDSGKAGSTVTSAATPVLFTANTGNGVLVDTTGSVDLEGTAGALGAGSIVASENALNGIFIQQTGTSGAQTLPTNKLLGVVTWHQAAGNGVSINTGSNVLMGASYAGANLVGVSINGSTTNYDTSAIVLGTATAFGHNILQSSASTDAGLSALNTSCGVHYGIPAAKGQTLYAAGNTWGSLDCSQSGTPGQISYAVACAAGVDLAGQSSGNTISVSNCTY